MIDPSVHVMAQQSIQDNKIKLNDILAHAENVQALQVWATGQEPALADIKQELLINYPHLHDR